MDPRSIFRTHPFPAGTGWGKKILAGSTGICIVCMLSKSGKLSCEQKHLKSNTSSSALVSGKCLSLHQISARQMAASVSDKLLPQLKICIRQQTERCIYLNKTGGYLWIGQSTHRVHAYKQFPLTKYEYINIWVSKLDIFKEARPSLSVSHIKH